ncbi:MAG: hypothetical protein PVG19_00995 [Desulfobacterales bacterium]|jgi:hypothetical protein
MKPFSLPITSPDAAKYHFPYQMGERLRSKLHGVEGIVVNAIYSGIENSEFYFITYYLETDSGETVQRPATDLERVGKDKRRH